MQIQHKPGEFFIEMKGKKAVLDYTISGKEMDIFHIFTDQPLLAEQLSQAAFDYAKENNLRVIPTCPFLKEFLKKHPEMEEITEHW